MGHDSARPSPRPRRAPAPDQIDVLVGMLLEQARLTHILLGGEERTFDYDAIRSSIYAAAAAPVGTNPRADRYRAHARRGIHSSAAQVDNSLLPCEQE